MAVFQVPMEQLLGKYLRLLAVVRVLQGLHAQFLLLLCPQAVHQDFIALLGLNVAFHELPLKEEESVLEDLTAQLAQQLQSLVQVDSIVKTLDSQIKQEPAQLDIIALQELWCQIQQMGLPEIYVPLENIALKALQLLKIAL